MHNNQVAVGGQDDATARVVTGVQDGEMSATSYKAINGSRLYATNQTITEIADTVIDYGDRIDIGRQSRQRLRRRTGADRQPRRHRGAIVINIRRG